MSEQTDKSMIEAKTVEAILQTSKLHGINFFELPKPNKQLLIDLFATGVALGIELSRPTLQIENSNTL